MSFKLNFDYVSSEARDFSLPKRATPESAGYDIFSPIDIYLAPKEQRFINLGIWWCPIALNGEKFFAKMFDKSGHALRYYFNSIAGVIDMDYNRPHNNWGLICENGGSVNMTIAKGKAICQFVLLPYMIAEDCINESLVTRTGGYGSTN